MVEITIAILCNVSLRSQTLFRSPTSSAEFRRPAAGSTARWLSCFPVCSVMPPKDRLIHEASNSIRLHLPGSDDWHWRTLSLFPTANVRHVGPRFNVSLESHVKVRIDERVKTNSRLRVADERVRYNFLGLS
ncbi:hypothetical protein VTK56DRAFT_8517 [Thermocarpiscus australiensis]